MSPLLCPKYDENALQITQARLIILTSRFSFVSSGIQRPGNAVLFFSREERLFSLSSSIEVPVSENKSIWPWSVKLYSKAGVLWRTNHNSPNMESFIRETVKQVLECDFLPSPPHISWYNLNRTSTYRFVSYNFPILSYDCRRQEIPWDLKPSTTGNSVFIKDNFTLSQYKSWGVYNNVLTITL